MQLSSFLHHLGFLASVSSSWRAAFGLEVNHLRKDQSTILSGENKDHIVSHKRVDLRGRFLAQNERKSETLFDQWEKELDYQVGNLETWITAEEDKKEKPCAWGFNVLGETLDYKSSNNIAFPSFDSNYWITPIKVHDLASTTIRLTGKSPIGARYFSFQTYTLDDLFSKVVGSIVDVNITLAADGSFTILVNDGEDTGDPQVSSLRGLPSGVNKGTVVLMYRTYLPVPRTSPAGGVSLPLISIQKGQDGELGDMEYCDEAEPTIEVEEPMEYNTKLQLLKPPSSVEYFLPPGLITPFPNADIAYLASMTIYPVKGYTLVARGKAPTFGDQDNPQVRYWSVCKLSLPSTKTVSCLTDEDATLDSEGRYVIVVAPERPSGAGFDFLSFGPGPFGILALRNMLPSPEFFDMSVQNIKNEDEDSDIRRKMGEFYPETVYCSIATIEDQGVEECF